jgi:hypothetical protein
MSDNDQTTEQALLGGIEKLLGNTVEDAPPVDKREEEEAAPAEETEEAPAKEATEDEPPPAEEAEEPSLPPPDGWTAEDQEWFKTLPPEKQERVLKRERELRSQESKRSNEHAEAIKTLQTERDKIVNERQQHITQLQNLIPALQQQIAGEFKDIKSIGDLEKLAATDPSRYVQWQAKQQAVAAASQEQQRLQAIQNQEAQQREAKWVAEQESKLDELIPEWKDRTKGQAELQEVREHLKERGIDAKLADNLRDAGMLAIARDALLYRKAQKAAKTAKPPAPKVLKSGSPTKGGQDEKVVALEKQFRKTGNLKDGARYVERLL